MNKEKIFATAFSWTSDFSFQKHEFLLKKFGSLGKAFCKENKNFQILKKIKEELDREGIKVCYIKDSNYPKLLKAIYSPPPILYYKGNIDIDWEKSISIVGSRKESPYANRFLKESIPHIINLGFNTISGMAIGVDTLVHQETINNNGKTIAVLGSGLSDENIYPKRNKKLSQEVELLISEFPPNTKVAPYNFPRRNRLIAGLSKYTLIIEAREKSGSLITAKSALEEGREVLSLVGSVYNKNSVGTNKLAQEGANIITGYKDIINILNIN
jgi:DNA processing protein